MMALLTQLSFASHSHVMAKACARKTAACIWITDLVSESI